MTAANKNRTAATVIASGLNTPHQIQLDESRHIGYVLEYAAPGNLYTIDLLAGTKRIISSNLYYASGLLLDTAITTAYISESVNGTSTYVISRINLATGAKSSFSPTFYAIYSLTWNDATQTGIFVTEPSVSAVYLLNIRYLNISQSPATVSIVWTSYLPESVVVTSPGQLLIIQDSIITKFSLSDPNFNSLGPTLLGIGNVPESSIIGGYATTSPSYFFYVNNSPFGGSLPIMVNYEKARAFSAVYYQILYDGIVQTTPWNDYKWSAVQNIFVLTTTTADSYGRFPVRQTGALWYNYWLGYFLDTTAYADNQYHTITVQLFDTYGDLLPAATSSVVIFVDNNWPHAYIQTVNYIPTNGTAVPVSACGIVQGTSDSFNFVIDASDPIGQNLLSWSLVAYWGANKAASVGSDSYSAHTTSVSWLGPSLQTTPIWHATVPGDSSSRQCAHTFFLGVWDRSINGLGYLHYAQYQISLTLLLS